MGGDLFELMGEQRPDFRWVIIGPARSGSTFHKDPNATSAWNAVIEGRKGWVMFPPDICPPGVYVTADESEVTSPLSVAEWFISYFDSAWEAYGPHARDPTQRGTMMVGVCEADEILYVPSGWWHLVVNLEDSVAVTQNFVSEVELPNVLAFLRDRPEQTSGWPMSTGCDHLFDSFCDILREHKPDVLERSLVVLHKRRGAARKAKTKSEMGIESTWGKLKAQKSSNDNDTFTFGFSLDDCE